MSLNLIQQAQATIVGGTPIPTNTLIQNILNNIVNPIITLMVGVAVLYFLWGVFEFVRNAESSEARKKGGMHILFGALGLFIMASAYGILNLILGTIGK
jgi:hypothetical protein